jgi:glycosyltransferase involved in cell wall biosynthesis
MLGTDDCAIKSTNADSTALVGRDMLCFSHDWSGDPLSKTHLMRALARENRILWVNSIGYRSPTLSHADLRRALTKLKSATVPLSEPEPNIFVLNPLAIPAYGLDQVRSLNRFLLRFQVTRAMRRLKFGRPLNWIFNPAAAVIAGAFDEAMVIYYCVDEYSAFTGVPSVSLSELEEQLLRRADLVIVSAEKLYESKSKFNRQTVLIRHGVDFKHFKQALKPETPIPEDVADLPKPIIGFFGLIADWVDLDLIAAVARQFPHASVVMLGNVSTDTSNLKRLSNVYLLGRKPYSLLPAYCKAFAVALMPFRINELTLNANPLKVREYLAAGLPVVSTAVPEVETLGLCRIGFDAESFLQEVGAALEDPGPTVERSEAVRDESWEARVKEISKYVRAVEQGHNIC